LKVALALVSPDIVSWHVLEPPQAPAHPAKVNPLLAAAVSVTAVPSGKPAEHWLLVGLQLIPLGLLVTWPPPVSVTVSVRVIWPKVAVTLVSAVIVKLQVLVPLQTAAVQPVNAEPAAGVAIRVSWVPLVNWVEQVGPQLMPSGVLVTVPAPVP